MSEEVDGVVFESLCANAKDAVSRAAIDLVNTLHRDQKVELRSTVALCTRFLTLEHAFESVPVSSVVVCDDADRTLSNAEVVSLLRTADRVLTMFMGTYLTIEHCPSYGQEVQVTSHCAVRAFVPAQRDGIGSMSSDAVQRAEVDAITKGFHVVPECETYLMNSVIAQVLSVVLDEHEQQTERAEVCPVVRALTIVFQPASLAVRWTVRLNSQCKALDGLSYRDMLLETISNSEPLHSVRKRQEWEMLSQDQALLQRLGFTEIGLAASIRNRVAFPNGSSDDPEVLNRHYATIRVLLDCVDVDPAEMVFSNQGRESFVLKSNRDHEESSRQTPPADVALALALANEENGFYVPVISHQMSFHPECSKLLSVTARMAVSSSEQPTFTPLDFAISTARGLMCMHPFGRWKILQCSDPPALAQTLRRGSEEHRQLCKAVEHATHGLGRLEDCAADSFQVRFDEHRCWSSSDLRNALQVHFDSSRCTFYPVLHCTVDVPSHLSACLSYRRRSYRRFLEAVCRMTSNIWSNPQLATVSLEKKNTQSDSKSRNLRIRVESVDVEFLHRVAFHVSSMFAIHTVAVPGCLSSAIYDSAFTRSLEDELAPLVSKHADILFLPPHENQLSFVAVGIEAGVVAEFLEFKSQQAHRSASSESHARDAHNLNQELSCCLSVCEPEMVSDRTIKLPCSHTACRACLAETIVRSSQDVLLAQRLHLSCSLCLSDIPATFLPQIVGPVVLQKTAAMRARAAAAATKKAAVEQDEPATSDGASPSVQWISAFACPGVDCSRLLVSTSSARVCECLDCGQRVCVRCQLPAHPGSRCDGARRFVVVEKGKTRSCPGCGYFIFRTAGCNHMTCALCSTEFCWTCGFIHEPHLDGGNLFAHIPNCIQEMRPENAEFERTAAASRRRSRRQRPPRAPRQPVVDTADEDAADVFDLLFGPSGPMHVEAPVDPLESEQPILDEQRDAEPAHQWNLFTQEDYVLSTLFHTHSRDQEIIVGN
eukprot:ANDGO_00402.mRNA.1 Protein ariadne-2